MRHWPFTIPTCPFQVKGWKPTPWTRPSFGGVVRPTLGVRAQLALNENWLAYARFSGWTDNDYEIRDYTAQLARRLGPSWALSLGYRHVDREVDVSELYNRQERDQLALGVWYFW